MEDISDHPLLDDLEPGMEVTYTPTNEKASGEVKQTKACYLTVGWEP